MLINFSENFVKVSEAYILKYRMLYNIVLFPMQIANWYCSLYDITHIWNYKYKKYLQYRCRYFKYFNSLPFRLSTGFFFVLSQTTIYESR